VKFPERHCPECEHYWVEHDLYGCQKYGCLCLLVDATHRYMRFPEPPLPLGVTLPKPAPPT